MEGRVHLPLTSLVPSAMSFARVFESKKPELSRFKPANVPDSGFWAVTSSLHLASPLRKSPRGNLETS